jgi:TRAP-type uncharacterized transport system fused permease subunit
MAGPTVKPFQKAFACAGVVFVVVVVPTLMLLGTNDGELIGELIAAVAIPALITGFFASRSAKAWSTWRIVAIFTLVLVICVALQMFGANSK